ncbi:hypothetical protein M413DRAFT_32940 [Hebeloma cylindrosporum]|uniref:CxC1-like cysteine cluster associated with KDZ transposases domain-containing protein n=1 Tax=Hebeloma cylindrosporum TaxID=76867 RepID=A0A0C3BU34_HEBCY|nr:hypothetical protein M413DRAFT_32940 [Hebeloma cylindrosporum h7]
MLVLLEILFQHLPPQFLIGLLYDIGCQTHRSCIKWDFLKPYHHRMIFGISVFHAFGHQWPCQIIYHPRKRKGFGFSDGEGCERFWHSISKLIGYLRVCGHHQRLYTLDLQIQHAGLENLEKLGVWLLRRTRHCFEKRKAAEEALAACGVPLDILQSEWEAQVKAQTKPLPRRSKNLGKKAVEEVIRLQKLHATLTSRVETLLAVISDATSPEYMILDVENKYNGALAASEHTSALLRQKERALGPFERQHLRQLAKSPYLRNRMNVLALKIRLRDKLRGRKFELERLERTFRKQVNEHKVHAHTESSVKRRDPSIQQLARSYNDLCTKIAKHIRHGRAPSGAICPDKIESKGLFALDVDDVIWQDTGLNDVNSESPPRWLCDAKVRSGILVMLDLDRCEEEELQEWDTANAAYENTEDVGLRYQLGIVKDSLCRLCAIWQRSVHTLDIATADEELDLWGPSEDEILSADIAAVTAALGNDPIEDDDEDSVADLDEEEEMDIGLITALEAVDLADAYRGGELEDVLDFVDDSDL